MTQKNLKPCWIESPSGNPGHGTQVSSDPAVALHDAAKEVGPPRDARCAFESECGNHLCAMFESDEEQRAMVTAYVGAGLRLNQKVLYFTDTRSSEATLADLHESGIDVETPLRRGQLVVARAGDAYLSTGKFSSKAMLSLLDAETALALKEGYSGLRASGEMTWALAPSVDTRDLMEYESGLNDARYKDRSIFCCQYDRRKFPASLLIDMVVRHPAVGVGSAVHNNLYHQPANGRAHDEHGAAILQLWLANLERVRTLELAVADSHAAFDGLPDPVYCVNAEYRIIWGNKAFAEWFRDREWKDRHCYEVVHGLSQPIVKCLAPGTIATGAAQCTRYFEPFLHRELAVHAAPIIDGDGSADHVLHTLHDLTDLKQIERQNSDLARRERYALTQLQKKTEEAENLRLDMAHRIERRLQEIVRDSVKS